MKIFITAIISLTYIYAQSQNPPAPKTPEKIVLINNVEIFNGKDNKTVKGNVLIVNKGNWLPTPIGVGYSLTFRFYGPKGDVASGAYYPPPLVKA